MTQRIIADTKPADVYTLKKGKIYRFSGFFDISTGDRETRLPYYYTATYDGTGYKYGHPDESIWRFKNITQEQPSLNFMSDTVHIEKAEKAEIKHFGLLHPAIEEIRYKK